MSNRRKPRTPWAARGPYQTTDVIHTRRQRKTDLRRGWVPALACRWDARLGRDRGCHVKQIGPWAQCLTHPTPEVNYRGRGA